MCSVSTILLSLRVVQHKYWNLAISLHRGISIVIVVLPLTVTFNFNRSSLAFNTHYKGVSFLTVSYFSPSKCGLNFSATISKTVHNFCEWGNFNYLLHPHDYVMQSKVILNSYGSTIYSFHFKNSTESFISYDSSFSSFHFKTFCKSCSHITLIMRFVCNFSFFLNSLSA